MAKDDAPKGRTNDRDGRKIAKRVSEPSMRLYFIFLLLFTAMSLLFRQYALAIAELALTLVLLVYTAISAHRNSRAVAEYIRDISMNLDLATKNTLQSFPLPMVIFQMDNGRIIWTNQLFIGITGDKERIFEYKITDAVPGFSGKWLMEGRPAAPELIELGGRKYQVYGNIVRTDADKTKKPPRVLATVYWADVTEYATVREEYRNSRPVIALIMLDNYEDLRGSLNDSANAGLVAAIDEKVNSWAAGCKGFLCKYDRDRYLFIFEERHIQNFIDSKFSLLDAVRQITVPSGIPATISVGVGRGAESLEESFKFASLGLEMALSRGGDQVVIKNRLNFEFYGGHSMEIERRTKVKSRVMANALSELITDASVIFIMGHKYADVDSVGAGVGICCIARKCGKKAKIVLDLKNNASEALINRMRTLPEYADVFIEPQDAMILADAKSLLVVVDTNRPEQVESESLLMSINHVAVVDHHRRAATYIENAVMNFQEPYASSAAELVTELMQYIVQQSDILRFEAEALLAGIVMDTKSFTLRTGSRTFDAASFLRRVGSDTTEVKKLLQNDFGSTVAKYGIIQAAKTYRDGIAMAAMDGPEDRVIAAQAADEMLNIAGIFASFVIYMDGQTVNISARSMGDINVQVILEKLGGGGNKSTAGAQIRDKTLEEVVAKLLEAIDEYMDKDKKKPQ